ncbi:uncharacterized protein PAC_20181 [Phialocephala subalpina]|uniref:Geranylgeranyl pyrophosphate synthetase n=1 Tax=Phialocephala subalpina TaxID=576137 RepID=A0A1L7XZ23_9HELO|nr:uncharacterized protein PAC_20181 [Phialocephala subalpina]
MSSHRGSYRGFDRGRGRGSWRGDANLSRAGPPQNLPPPKPLGPTIDSINIKTLLTEEDAPTIKGVEYVASYNWFDGKSPVILVPGSPPAWTPPAIDPQLKPDSEDVFRDINAARYASYPLEPTFRSLQAMQPHYDLQAVDIVGCGSTFGNLLRFAGSESKTFRFDVDVIRDTVLFVRKESSPAELITDLRGYGHTFPEAYTTWDYEVRNSCSHQRIIQYEFGGLKFLVRTETDGYVKEADAKAPSTSQLSLDDALGTMAMSFIEASQDPQLQLKTQGMRVRQDQIFDIKTRASYKPFDMNEILPRLWVNQTSKFLIAYHQSGLFDKPKVQDVRQDVIRWENSNSALLARFHALVKRIVDVVRDSDQQQCEVSWDGQGPLCVTKKIGEGRRALPSDLVHLFEVS